MWINEQVTRLRRNYRVILSCAINSFKTCRDLFLYFYNETEDASLFIPNIDIIIIIIVITTTTLLYCTGMYTTTDITITIPKSTSNRSRRDEPCL